MKRLSIKTICEKIASLSPKRRENYLKYKLQHDEIEGFKVTLNNVEERENEIR